MGAKATIVPPDKKTDEWLMGRARQPYTPVHSDPDSYDSVYDYDVTDLEPQVAVPFRVDNVRPVSELAGLEVDQVFIGTCTNGRLEDLEVAARIISGKPEPWSYLPRERFCGRHCKMESSRRWWKLGQ
jgi:methanogen homoaconitase large subunit